jgi:hypothetical protein
VAPKTELQKRKFCCAKRGKPERGPNVEEEGKGATLLVALEKLTVANQIE